MERSVCEIVGWFMYEGFVERVMEIGIIDWGKERVSKERGWGGLGWGRMSGMDDGRGGIGLGLV